MADLTSLSRRAALKLVALTVAATGGLSSGRAARADVPRVLPAGTLPDDIRLGALTDLNAYFPWTPSRTVEEWAIRSQYVTRQLKLACGLWPMPTRPPLKATVHGKVDCNDHTVERVILETSDGLYCTGSLYRPAKTNSGKMPAILCPHGHWPRGRFYKHTDEMFAKELETKAESMPCGRYPLQARCVQLARMGCLVFMYDMLGYADNTSLSANIAHLFKEQRADLNSPDHWGLFSAQAEMRCLNIVALQTWNSVRALDWISSMNDVDTNRIGVTGASGGGTQTFILGGVDPRPAAFFPAVMVSTSMQGGCTCENASLLRVNTGNIELAALLAPRPLGMTAADDWTKELETKGLPELKQHYAMLGVPDNVEGKYRPFPHNYNQPSRLMMYEFFNKHLKLGLRSPIEEKEFTPLTEAELTVWDAEHPAPESNVDNELKIVRGFAADQARQLAELVPTNQISYYRYREIIGGAWDVIIGRQLPGKDDFTQINKDKSEGESLLKFRTVVRMHQLGEEIPTLFYLPRNWNKHVVIWVTDEGKSSLLNRDGEPNADVQKLIDAGVSVVMPDLLYQGEFLSEGKPLEHARRVSNPREVPAYTLGYNHSLFSQRVHDVLSMIAFCRFSKYEPAGVHLIGLGKVAGPVAAAAGFQAATAVDRMAIGTKGFRFASLTDAFDVMTTPGAVKYGDVPGLLGLAAPHPLWLAGEGATPPATAVNCYKAVGAPDITQYTGAPEGEAASAVSWILKSIG